MSSGPLAGRRVVVTRARSQASSLVTRLAAYGATVVELPVIAVEEPSDGGAALEVAAHRLASGAYQWVAVTSANAVSRLIAVLGDRPVPPSVRWAAVGPATARALADAGVRAPLVPEVALPEALADLFPPADPRRSLSADRGATGTVLFPRAESVREVLAPGLRAKGWLVDEVVAYRTVAGDPAPAAVAAARRADAVVFTSPSTVERTLDLLSPEGVPALVVSIGPVTSNAVRAAGRAVDAEASPHTVDGVVDALVACCRAGSPPSSSTSNSGVPPTGSDRTSLP